MIRDIIVAISSHYFSHFTRISLRKMYTCSLDERNELRANLREPILVFNISFIWRALDLMFLENITAKFTSVHVYFERILERMSFQENYRRFLNIHTRSIVFKV